MDEQPPIRPPKAPLRLLHPDPDKPPGSATPAINLGCSVLMVGAAVGLVLSGCGVLLWGLSSAGWL